MCLSKIKARAHISGFTVCLSLNGLDQYKRWSIFPKAIDITYEKYR